MGQPNALAKWRYDGNIKNMRTKIIQYNSCSAYLSEKIRTVY